MVKQLSWVVKECRHLLEQDFAGQLSCSGSFSEQERHTRVQNAVIAFLLDLASIRCFETQIWRQPSRLTAVADSAQGRDAFRSLRKRLYSTCRFLRPSHPEVEFFPAALPLKTVLHHFTATLPPDVWRSDHVLGWSYQACFENTPEQKHRGQFYTPEPLADSIVRQTLQHAELSADFSGETAFSVCDLACGAGVFALHVVEQLYQWYRHRTEALPHAQEPLIPRILEKHLFLVDNDPRACQLAALNLYLLAKRLEPSCSPGTINILCRDALTRQDAHLFPSQFDVIVGNPPYIVINQLHTPNSLIQLYKSYQSAAFKINTFALFIERGLELLKPGGTLGMIVPNTALNQVYFEPLRAYILETSKIRAILDTKRMFANASVENCILILQREENQAERLQNRIQCWNRDLKTSSRSQVPLMNPPEMRDAPLMVPQRHFAKAPLHMFHTHLDEATYALMEKIAAGNPKLGEICESHDGVNPGNARRKLLLSAPVDETCKKVLNGKNIGRYWSVWGGLYVRYNRQALSRGDTVRWGHKPSLEAEKLLTRQTADRIIGTFDAGEFYATNSIHTTVLRPGIRDFSLKYLLAVLNSTLMSFYYRKFIAEAGQLFAQVKLVNLRQLPIKQIPLREQHRFIEIVETLLAHPNGREKAILESEWPRLNTELDRLVYAVYDLTPEEIQQIHNAMDVACIPFDKLREGSFHADGRGETHCSRKKMFESEDSS